VFTEKLSNTFEKQVVKDVLFPDETIYGTTNRMEWIKKFIHKNQTIIDVGCGTGSMMTIPLYLQGYKIGGYDLDLNSIEYGKKLLRENGIEDTFLFCQDITALEKKVDVVILSQVLEHLPTPAMHTLIADCLAVLKPGGLFLITVPNGYGIFELESFLWYKLKLGKAFAMLKIPSVINRLKKLIIVEKEEFPSSLDSSPHVQRFTYFSLEKALRKHPVIVKEKAGGSFISGPFSNLLFTGIKPIMRINNLLGRLMPMIASDFYIAVQKPFDTQYAA